MLKNIILLFTIIAMIWPFSVNAMDQTQNISRMMGSYDMGIQCISAIYSTMNIINHNYGVGLFQGNLNQYNSIMTSYNNTLYAYQQRTSWILYNMSKLNHTTKNSIDLNMFVNDRKNILTISNNDWINQYLKSYYLYKAGNGISLKAFNNKLLIKNNQCKVWYRSN